MRQSDQNFGTDMTGKLRISAYRFVLNRPPPGVPNGMWSSFGGLRVCCAISGLGLLVLLVLHASFGLGAILGVRLPWHLRFFCEHLSMPIAVVFFVCLVAVPRRACKRFVKKLRHHDNKLCTECGYVLDGLPDEHTCPECGTPYKIEVVRSLWQSFTQRQA